jgi:hypothetical protein
MATYRHATKEISVSNAKAFLHQLNADEDGRTTKKSAILYTAIGKVDPWSSDPTPDDHTLSEQHLKFDMKREFYGAKKVQPSDAAHVVPRHNWVSGTVYSMYRDTDTNIFNRAYYVITDEFNVYKCLNNFKGATSTTKPTGYSTLPITTSDGYMWKYLFTVSVDDADKFLTTSYLPVKKISTSDGTAEEDRQLLIQNAAVNGSIEVVETNAVGSGYKMINNGLVSAGGKNDIQLSTSGSDPSPIDNYYNGSSVYIISGTGAGQLRRVINYSGSTKLLTVNTAFSTIANTDSRIVISPTVTIIGDGAGAKAYSRVDTSTGAIANVTMIATGSKYSRAQAIITANSIHGSGATANVVISPLGGHGDDPISELYSDKIMLNTKLQDPEGSYITGAGHIPSNTEFRTISIIKDPILKVNSNNIIQGTEYIANTSNSPDTLRLATRLTVSYLQMSGGSPVNPLVVRDIISNERNLLRAKSGALEFVTDLGQTTRNTNALSNAVKGANANIVYLQDDPSQSDASYYHVYINNVESYGNYSSFQVDDNIIKSTSETNIAQVTAIKGPEANTFSGEILYTENISPVTRDTEQIEDIKIILDF